MRKRTICFVLTCLLSLTLFGCSDSSLAGAAQRLDQIAKIAGAAQQLVVRLNGQGANVLSDEEARPFMAGFRRVGEVGLVATGVIRNLQSQPNVTEDDKAQVAAALKAVQDAISELTISGAVGIKNPTTQKQIQVFVGQAVQLATSLVNAFISEFGTTPELYLSEVQLAKS